MPCVLHHHRRILKSRPSIIVRAHLYDAQDLSVHACVGTSENERLSRVARTKSQSRELISARVSRVTVINVSLSSYTDKKCVRHRVWVRVMRCTRVRFYDASRVENNFLARRRTTSFAQSVHKLRRERPLVPRAHAERIGESCFSLADTLVAGTSFLRACAFLGRAKEENPLVGIDKSQPPRRARAPSLSHLATS